MFVLGTAGEACRGSGDVHTPSPTALVDDHPRRVSLDSFRYTLSAEASNLLGAPTTATGTPTAITVRVEGEVAGADRQRSTTLLTLEFGSIETEHVQVGNRAWTRDGRGAWVEERASPEGAATRALGLSLDPGVLVGEVAHERLRQTVSGMDSVPEVVGGLETERLTLSAEQLRVVLGAAEGSAAASLAGIAPLWTLWVTGERWLSVRLLADAAVEQGGRVRVELAIRDHNTPVVVEPPVGVATGVED